MNNRIDVKGHNFKWLINLMDIVILLAVFIIFVHFIVEAMGWRNYDGDSGFFRDRFGHLFLFIVSYIASVSIFPSKPRDLDSVLETTFRAVIQVGFMYIFFAISVAILYRTFPGHLLMWSGIVNCILIVASHVIITKRIVASRSKEANVIDVLFVGEGRNNFLLDKQLRTGFSTFSYRIHGYFSDTPSPENSGDCNLLGTLKDIQPYLETHQIDAVCCTLPPQDVKPLIKLCEDNFITFYYLPEFGGYLHRKMEFTQYDDVTLVSLHNEPLADPYNRFKKRVIDIVISGLFLITLYPIIWVIVAIGTKLTSPGPVLFRQQRTGYEGKPFTMLKFRSMKVNADADTLQATADDPRKTRFGNFLRRTSIDELPQFINVFKGDMSIIGPRPHMEAQTENYTKLIDEYLVRHMVLPGLTGWAQVNGCRGETKTVEQMADRVRNDIWYIENWSLSLDFRIFVKTVVQIFKGDDQAY